MSLQQTTEAVKNRANAAASLGSSIKFVFDEGIVFLDGKGTANEVHNEDHDADCIVSINKSDFDSLLSGELNPMEAFMGGKLQIDGDMGVAMKLGTLFG